MTLSIHKAVGSTNTGGSPAVAITTTKGAQLLLAVIGSEVANDPGGGSVAVSAVSGGGLTWTRRKQLQWTGGRHTNPQVLETWYAIAHGTLSAQTITATMSVTGGGTVDNQTISVISIDGADLVNPFDTNACFPATATNPTGTGSQVSVSGITTDDAYSMVMLFAANDWATSLGSTNNGFELTLSTNNSGGTDWQWQSVFQRVFGRALAAEAVASAGTAATYWGAIVDAIRSRPISQHNPVVAVMSGGDANMRALNAIQPEVLGGWDAEWLRTFSNGAGSNWKLVRYGNGKFVALQANSAANNYNSVAVSDASGQRWWWVPQNIGATLEDIVWAQSLGLWIAACSTGSDAAHHILTTPDLETWTFQALPVNSIALRSIAWSPELSIAVGVGDANAIYWSTDGSTWSNTGMTLPGTAKDWTRIVWAGDGAGGGPQKFVVITNNGGGANDYAYSSDGKNWTQATLTGSAYAWRDIAYGNGVVVVVGGNTGVVVYSTTATAYTQINTGLGSSAFQCITYSAALGKWVGMADTNVLYSTTGTSGWAVTSGAGTSVGASAVNGIAAAPSASAPFDGVVPIVQFTSALQDSGASPLSATFGSSPTPGNVLVAFLVHFNNGATASTGWTQLFSRNGGVKDGVAVLWKIAGEGESSTQTPSTQTGALSLAIYEIGPTAVPAPECLGVYADDVDKTSSPVAFSLPTGDDNERLIGIMSGITGGPPTFTPDAAFTVDAVATPTATRSLALMHTTGLAPGAHSFSNAFAGGGYTQYVYVALTPGPAVTQNLSPGFLGGGDLTSFTLYVNDGNIPTDFVGGGLLDVTMQIGGELVPPMNGGGLITLDGLTIDLPNDMTGSGNLSGPGGGAMGVVEYDLLVDYVGGGLIDLPLLDIGDRVPTRMTQGYAQVLGSDPQAPLKATQVMAQVMGTATPDVKATQVTSQVMGTNFPDTRLTQVYVQILALRTPTFEWHEEDMLVYEVFPKNISFNSIGAVRFATDVVQVDSGADQRGSRWDQSLMEFDVAYGVRTMEDLHALIAFFRAMRGRLYSFLIEDVVDHKSTLAVLEEARAAPAISPQDQQLGVGDNLTKTFQLVKHYKTLNALQEQVRIITKPKANTTIVSINDLQVANFTVDLLTGIVTFVSEYTATGTLSVAQPGAAGTARITGAPGFFANFAIGKNIVTTGWAVPNNVTDETMVISITGKAGDSSYIDVSYDSTKWHVGEVAETGVANVTVRTHPAPVLGEVVKAGFEFWVPVRFDTDRLPVTLEDYGIGGAADVKLVEVRPGEEL